MVFLSYNTTGLGDLSVAGPEATVANVEKIGVAELLPRRTEKGNSLFLGGYSILKWTHRAYG